MKKPHHPQQLLMNGFANPLTCHSNFTESKTMIRTIAAIAAFLFSFYTAGSWAQLGGPVQSTQAASAASGPGLEETQKWLKETFSTVFGNKRLIFFEGCTAMLMKKEDYGVEVYGGAEKFPMGDVVAKAGEFSQELVNKYKLKNKFYIKARGINDKTVFVFGSRTRAYSESECVGKCNSIADNLSLLKTHARDSNLSELNMDLELDSFLMAERIANAFNHAQKLCKKRELDAQSSKAAEDYSRNAKKPGDLF